ncbi:MAG TPA: metallopeptidase family protein [Candidatus Binatia bacterium]|nr:metallopeptidase family protein [Candidatus Binatia bacterium]
MDRERFAELVAEAVDALPEQFAERLDNVAIVIDDEPSRQLLQELELDPRRDTLFGLFHGVPLRERGANHAMHLPDTITIFYRPLVHAYRSPGAIRREISRTLVHEIGHLFGFSEEEIRHAGY